MITQEPEQLDPGTTKIKDAVRIVVKAQDCYRPRAYGRSITPQHVQRIAGEAVSFTATALPPGLTEQDRAREYTIRNRARAPMKPVDLFKADVVMQEPSALAIKRICGDSGTGIIGYSTATHSYPNIASLRDLHVLNSAGNLEQVIRIIRAVYDGKPLHFSHKAMTAHMLRAVNKFLVFFKNDSNFQESRLIYVLKQQEATYWVGSIMQDAQYSSEGIGVLKRAYNARLANVKQLKGNVGKE